MLIFPSPEEPEILTLLCHEIPIALGSLSVGLRVAKDDFMKQPPEGD